MTGRLDGRVALVTGGASGIGAACASNLTARGARVFVGDIVAPDVDRDGTEFIELDVTVSANVDTVVRQVVTRAGRLDIAVNNAGVVGALAPLERVTDDDWQRVIAVNLTGVFNCLRSEVTVMASGASIINMASILGMVADAEAPIAYVASKHAVIGMTKSAAVQYAPRGLRVNAVAPGRVSTPLLAASLSSRQLEERAAKAPMLRLGTGDEVASLVSWLAGDEASFVTGAVFPVDGGFLAQ